MNKNAVKYLPPQAGGCVVMGQKRQ